MLTLEVVLLYLLILIFISFFYHIFSFIFIEIEKQLTNVNNLKNNIQEFIEKVSIKEK